MVKMRIRTDESDKKIGTIGDIGPRGQGRGMLLPTLRADTGEYGKAWFTWAQIEQLGMSQDRVGDAVVVVGEKVL